jgi:hypothetical protein
MWFCSACGASTPATCSCGRRKEVEPAFPHTQPPYDVSEDECGTHHAGMSLRDYFAAKALPALIEQNGLGECYSPAYSAKEAYEYADAMLKAREAK